MAAKATKTMKILQTMRGAWGDWRSPPRTIRCGGRLRRVGGSTRVERSLSISLSLSLSLSLGETMKTMKTMRWAR